LNLTGDNRRIKVEHKPFFIGNFDKNLYLKLYGDITLKNIYPLKKFLSGLDFSYFFHIIFDFQKTDYLDSTSLGIIINTGLKYKDMIQRRLSFINMPKGLDDSFRTFGFYDIAEINKEVSISISEEQLVPLPDEDEKIDGLGILEAHKTLANMNEKNMEMFRTLIDLLEKRL
jgi:hypothetical protein